VNWRSEWKPLLWITAIFLAAYFLPVGIPRFDNAVREAFELVKWYAREHVVLCLLPAFFIAGAIGVFVSQASVMRYLGAGANKVLAYGVASVSGSVLAVCSCTVLPLFAGIYRMGAGLGPASAFLYSGPAINVLAIILTARILGWQIGLARAVGAIVFSIVIGLLMHFIFRKEEQARVAAQAQLPVEKPRLRLWQTATYFALMVAVLVFANWAKPDVTTGFWYAVYTAKWYITGLAAIALAFALNRWFGVAWWKLGLAGLPAALIAVMPWFIPAWSEPEQLKVVMMVAVAAGIVGLSWLTSTDKAEMGDWFQTTWGFTRQIMPLLLIGVLVSGLLLGRPGNEGLIPNSWVAWAVGGNSLWANFFAAIVGAFMYFATLTEIPILQGLIGSGMGQGPALALLLAGPALSLPSMLVINTILGPKKTIVYCSLVVVLSTLVGMLFGAIVH
jgi:uncharacterized protein